MSTRGPRTTFEPGEICLCFEPDPSKARVLYDAKILEVVTSRDGRGRKRCEYHVHFQGWNSSWDRIVPASFVLKNSTENRQLMKQLANTVREIRNTKTLKRKIDQLVKLNLKGNIPRFHSDSESDTTDEDDDNDDDDEDDQEENEDGDEENGVGNGNAEDSSDDEVITYNPRRGYGGRRPHIEHMQDTTEEETEEQSTDEEEGDPYDGLNHLVGEVNLEIPGNLQHKLEDDCYYIKSKNKVIQLPCDPNIITILEGYVKNFAINVLCATVDKLRPRDVYPPLPEKNIELCKEVMDGLRVIFDFVLPRSLLYNSEKATHNKVTTTYHPTAAAATQNTHLHHVEPEEKLQSPKLRSSVRSAMSPTSPEPSAKIPRLSPKQVKQERQEDSDDEAAGPSRRMTRHSYQEEIGRKTRCTKPTPVQNGVKHSGPSGDTNSVQQVISSESPSKRKNSLRSSFTRQSEGPVQTVTRNGTLTDRVTPPPPLLIPNTINSTKTNSSGCSTPTMLEGTLSDKEGALNSVLAWQLIQDSSYYEQSPTPPSLVYGAHHLLRLFVQLPHVISQMAVPDVDFQALQKHLQMFLEYLSDRGEELFPDNVYVDAASHCQPKSRR